MKKERRDPDQTLNGHGRSGWGSSGVTRRSRSGFQRVSMYRSTLLAASCRDLEDKWLYLAVTSELLWPKICWTSYRVRPELINMDAYMWRRSCNLACSKPACGLSPSLHTLFIVVSRLPCDYESDGLWGSWAATGRKGRGFRAGKPNRHRKRTYSEPGGGRFRCERGSKMKN